MPSPPLIACSSGLATVSAMALGFAPGQVAFTITVGGTTSGYSLIGSCGNAIRPARKMRAESTPAKIGRLMKNCESFMAFLNAPREEQRSPGQHARPHRPPDLQRLPPPPAARSLGRPPG